MNIHELKIAPQYFNDVLSGRKKAEVRFNDRDYKIGDTLNLNEFDSVINASTGRGCSVQVTHILHEVGLKYGYVNLSFKLIKDKTIDCQIEQLQLRIKELESQSNIINQAIADYLENDLLNYANLYDANHAVSVEHIEYSINKLRTKHD